LVRAREEFDIQNPQSRIDELLFQEATAKISAPNSKYNCSIDQNFEVRFSNGKSKSCFNKEIKEIQEI
jgi:hypothetical protein